MFAGTTVPIGERPDGFNWTGFASLPDGEGPAYLLPFRGVTPRSDYTVDLAALAIAGERRLVPLYGRGHAAMAADGEPAVHIDAPRDFL